MKFMAPTVGEISEEERKRDVKRNRDRQREREREKKRKHVERKEECTRGRGIKLFGLYIKH